MNFGLWSIWRQCGTLISEKPCLGSLRLLLESIHLFPSNSSESLISLPSAWTQWIRPISKNSHLDPARDSESAIVDEHSVVPPAPLQVGQARPLTRGGVVELHACQVLGGCGDPP